MPKIIVDQNKCIGCGLCVSLAEKIFKINDQGKAEVIGKCGEDEECDKKVAESVESCPVLAISNE